jgi:hypothetical protein
MWPRTRFNLQNASRRAGIWRRSSAEHLIRLEEERWGDDQAEHLRRLEVDDQLEGGGLLHRQVGGLGALEDLVDIGGATVQLATVFPVLQEPPASANPAHGVARGSRRFRSFEVEDGPSPAA